MLKLENEKQEERKAFTNKRALGIGGSEIPIILGASEWRTPYDLWLEKTGKKLPADISSLPHVQRGVTGEKVCRMLIESERLVTYKPKQWEIPGTPFRCSDDGYSPDRRDMLEIKCMGMDKHNAIGREGITAIPEMYLMQVQYNLAVSGLELCTFVSFRPEDGTRFEVPVKANRKEGERLKKAALKFWHEHVLAEIPPELTDKDFIKIKDESFLALAKDYLALANQKAGYAAKVEELDEEMAELKLKLNAFADTHPAIMGGGIRLKRIKVRGRVQYDSIPELRELDLEKYRGPATEQVRITAMDDKA